MAAEDTAALLSTAASLQANGHFQRALHIYLSALDSNDALGAQVAECYEAMGRSAEARYWAARTALAHPGNPGLQRMLARLGAVDAEPLNPSFRDSWNSTAGSDEFEETQRILATVPGGRELLEWFGGSVSFHDAEVVSLLLDREGESSLNLHTSHDHSHALVTLVLADWIDTTLSGFSHQNVIGDLVLRSPAGRQVEVWERGVGVRPGEVEIELTPIFGAYGVIRATIQRIDVTPLSEPPVLRRPR